MMPKVKKAQGVDIMRSFCGLNDHRNLKLSVTAAKDAGMIAQGTLSITYSEIHTVNYYMGVVDKLVEYGADEICLKDMAGIGRPHSLGLLVKTIKTKYPHIIVQYHGHSGPGLSVASMLEVAKAGAEYIDVAMEPLTWGMIHPDVITIQAMLKDAGFLVPDINMKAYMEARRLTQSFMNDFLGDFIDPRNKLVNALMLGSGLPGGMMGSMMADLKGMHGAINSALRQKNKPEVSLDDLLLQLFQEVEYVWPMVGYPPLVTPFSQYVKNIALMNIFTMAKGEPRFSMIDKDSWNMILGKMGTLPGKLAPEIIELAKKNNLEFYTGEPQAAYPDQLPEYRKEMAENGWDVGQDEEELFELAMHDRQYRDYKSGIAKKRFEEELAKVRADKVAASAPVVLSPAQQEAKTLAYISEKYPNAKPIVAPSKGTLLWEVDYEDKSIPPAPGTAYKENDIIAHIEAYYGIDDIINNYNGKLIDTIAKQGAKVQKGEIIGWVE
jgi:pyruvate carboxylase subunit B